MWWRHWGLLHDPFDGRRSTYVSLPSHDEAIGRLVAAIAGRRRVVSLFAEAGLGKTTVLRGALELAREPRRRMALIHAPSDGRDLLGGLADALGLPSRVGGDRERVWRSLARAVRAAVMEGRHVVLAVDGWDRDPESSAMQDLHALLDAGPPSGSWVSLVRVGRGGDAEPDDSLALSLGLERLTRSEAEVYLDARLDAVGCRGRILTPRAISRLHSWSEGVPRALDQLAGLALMDGASRGLEAVTPDVVDGVALRGLVGVHSGLSSA